MKKAGIISCLTLLMVVLSQAFVFGADSNFKIVDTYPVDGQENTTKENMCVKLNFNNEVSQDGENKINKNMFEIKDKKGKKVPIIALVNPDDKKQVMVLADTNKKLDIKDNTEYILTISDKVSDAEGNTLGDKSKVSFKTMDQGKSTKIYMLMMFVMFGGMFVFMAISTKKHAETEAEDELPAELKINPYKEAKRTGKSVEEIIAEQEKARAKYEKKMAKKAAKKQAEEVEEAEEVYEETLAPGHFKVKGVRTVASGGGTYITGRKAEAEARKAREQKWAQQSKKKKRK